jgi:hypothetical protein
MNLNEWNFFKNLDLIIAFSVDLKKDTNVHAGGTNKMIKTNPKKWRVPLMIATPTEGWIRFEWAHARFGQVIPVNWAAANFDLNYVAMGYSVEDAYNLITHHAIAQNVEWLLIVEDDVLLPGDCFVKMNEYMKKKEIPVVSGLYFTKGVPAEALVFRGRGTGSYTKWKWGQKVWCDGIPMGCFLIHMSLLKVLSESSEFYNIPSGERVRRVFVTPRKVDFDYQTWISHTERGTQDLYICDRILKEGVLKKAGWPKIARKKWPFLVDTTIFCKHIDRGTGKKYPLPLDEKEQESILKGLKL